MILIYDFYICISSDILSVVSFDYCVERGTYFGYIVLK